MATISFEEMLVIETDEQIKALEEALEEAERRGPYVPTCDILKVLDESKKRIKDLVFD